MKPLVIVVNGEPGAGKDTFVVDCCRILGHMCYATIISSVYRVKEAAKILGWDGAKDERGRKFLSDLKDLSTAAYDGPLNYMLGRIEKTFAKVAFVYIREPMEIDRLKERLPGTLTLVVERHGLPKFDNTGDRDTGEYEYDFHIPNHGSLAALTLLAEKFVDDHILPLLTATSR